MQWEWHIPLLDDARKLELTMFNSPFDVSEAHIRSVRPGYGMAPKYVDEIVGMRVMKDVAFGDAIQSNLFSPIK